MFWWIGVLLVVLGGNAEAALTQAQFNAHVKTVLMTVDESARCPLIVSAIAYAGQGADEQEAMKRMVKELFQAWYGVDPTTTPARRHRFFHWVDECQSGSGFEP